VCIRAAIADSLGNPARNALRPLQPRNHALPDELGDSHEVSRCSPPDTFGQAGLQPHPHLMRKVAHRTTRASAGSRSADFKAAGDVSTFPSVNLSRAEVFDSWVNLSFDRANHRSSAVGASSTQGTT
jgi:hypothetical protein